MTMAATAITTVPRKMPTPPPPFPLESIPPLAVPRGANVTDLATRARVKYSNRPPWPRSPLRPPGLASFGVAMATFSFLAHGFAEDRQRGVLKRRGRNACSCLGAARRARRGGVGSGLGRGRDLVRRPASALGPGVGHHRGPELLFLDEPTTGFDRPPGVGRGIWSRGCATLGATVPPTPGPARGSCAASGPWPGPPRRRVAFPLGRVGHRSAHPRRTCQLLAAHTRRGRCPRCCRRVATQVRGHRTLEECWNSPPAGHRHKASMQGDSR